MPLTLSHPAAVIGLRRMGLPMSGLVAGSMIPDLPMLAVTPYGYVYAHRLIGLITTDLVSGVVAVVVWMVLVRGVLPSASPPWVRERLTGEQFTVRQWALLAPAVVFGATTHVVWDSFTHVDRWGVRHVGWLSSDHLGKAGYHWAQAASSAIGLVIVVACGALTLSRRTPYPRGAVAVGAARWTLAIVTICAACVGIASAVAEIDGGLHSIAFAFVVRAIGVEILGVTVAGAVWRYASRQQLAH